MASKISISLDTSKENYILTKCKQDDDLTLEALIYENGLALELSNKEIIIKALKADNTYINQSTEISKENNKITAELVRDFTRVPGTTKIEVLLIEGGKQNTTFSFYLEVAGSVTKGAVESSNTVTIIEELDKKVLEAGQVKAETELLIKSGGAATKEDITKVNSSLEHIETETELALSQKRDKSIKITSSDMDKSSDSSKIGLDGLKEEVITALSGGTTINTTNVLDESLVYEKYSRKSIAKEHLTFNSIEGVKGNNLFNLNICTDGYYVKADGNLDTNASYSVTDFIPVEENTTYTVNNVAMNIVFFRLNKTRLSNQSGNGTITFTTPTGCRFIRFNIGITGGQYLKTTCMMNIGSSLLTYESYGNKLDVNTIVDNSIRFFKTKGYLGTINETNCLEFHTTNGTLKQLKSFGFTYENTFRNVPLRGDVIISNYNINNCYMVYIDLDADATIKIYQAGVTPPAKCVLIAIIYKYDITTINTKAITIYDTSDTLIKERIKYLDNTIFFNDTDNRLILPNKIFMVENDNLTIYRDNFLSGMNIVEGFKCAYSERQPSMKNKVKGINYELELNPSTTSDKFRLSLLTNYNTSSSNYLRYKDITKVLSSNKTGTVKGLLIGDSLTENQRVHTALGNYLKAKGITFKSIGTYLNETYGKFEGRASWSYSNYVGIDTLVGNDRILPQPTGDTTNRQCPFLYLATDDDKAVRPEMCFRNTGKKDELSYATDSDKTGDFYIFDFKRYITEHSLEVPDVVTIALGTNDCWVYDRDTTKENKALLSLDIMIKQIKNAYPNIKIGVIPPLCPATNWQGNLLWSNSLSHLVERIIKKVENYQASYSNIEIVPIYLFINRDFSFEPVNETDLNSENTTKIAQRNEFVHYNTSGLNEYLSELGAYYINMI